MENKAKLYYVSDPIVRCFVNFFGILLVERKPTKNSHQNLSYFALLNTHTCIYEYSLTKIKVKLNKNTYKKQETLLKGR